MVDLEVQKVREGWDEHALVLEVTDAAKLVLGEKGYDPEFGARPLRRVITNMVEDRLADGILAGTFKLGSTVHIDAANGELVMTTIESEGPALADGEVPALASGETGTASPETSESS